MFTNTFFSVICQLRVFVRAVFKTLVKNEISYNSKVVVIATSISRDSVHPVLRRSHGSHVFSKSVEIPLPDQKQRIEILQAILRKHDEDMSVDNIGYSIYTIISLATVILS